MISSLHCKLSVKYRLLVNSIIDAILCISEGFYWDVFGILDGLFLRIFDPF